MRNLKIAIILSSLISGVFFIPQWSLADNGANAELSRFVNLNDAAGVKASLEKGADPNFNPGDRAVLSRAAQAGEAEVVQALLAAKADINILDSNGETPLMRAAESDKSDVVSVFVNAKAKLDVQNSSGETALIMAVNNHNAGMVKALVDGGANVNLKNTDGHSPVMTACITNADEAAQIVSILASKKAELNTGDSMNTPLSYAVTQGNKAVVEALLQGGADPNLKAENGSYPLALAFDSSEPAPLVSALLKAKANPNITSSSGSTPLHLASEKGLLENVEQLLTAGADLNAKDSLGDTPLATAKRASHNDVAELLIKHGAAGQ